MAKRKIFKLPKNNTVYIVVYIFAFILVIAGGFFNNNKNSQKDEETVPLENIDLTEEFLVTDIIDGDTIKLDKIGTVRLIGIDTPETQDPRKEVECFGKEATQKLQKLIDQKSVKIELDPTQDLYDRYNRVLAYIFLDKENINEIMIEEGYAYEYTYEDEYKYQTAFKKAQANAQGDEAGLWSPDSCNGER